MKNLGYALVSAVAAVPITALLWLSGVVHAFDGFITVLSSAMASAIGEDQTRIMNSPTQALIAVFVAVTLIVYFQLRHR
jgi:uncharacterized membrane protein YfcA